MKPRLPPTMTTDAEVEVFLEQDLSGLGLAAFKPLTERGPPGPDVSRASDAFTRAQH